MIDQWIADRTHAFDSSGIRRVFDLAAQLENPVNLSIGQPHFDVPEPVKAACVEAIEAGKNGYAVTQGIPPLRERLQADLDARFGQPDRRLLVTSGSSGGLVLAMLTLVNPGDEVIIFDPYFVMYDSLVRLVGGVPILIDTYPDFSIPLDEVAERITARTKMVLVNSPGNPTGVVYDEPTLKGLAELCDQRGVVLLSDEIYRLFCYDEPFVSPAGFNPNTLVIDGFSKSHGMTGWRVGVAHGPATLIDAMTKIQQYTFVCSPQPAQWGALKAMETSISEHVDAYHAKRDKVVSGLQDYYRFAKPNGAFYLFAEAPNGDGTRFVERAIADELLIIPGKVFSRKDTHFRLSYAADDAVIERGIEILQAIARSD